MIREINTLVTSFHQYLLSQTFPKKCHLTEISISRKISIAQKILISRKISIWQKILVWRKSSIWQKISSNSWFHEFFLQKSLIENFCNFQLMVYNERNLIHSSSIQHVVCIWDFMVLSISRWLSYSIWSYERTYVMVFRSNQKHPNFTFHY